MARIHELTAARNGKGLWLLALLSGVLAAVFTIVAIKSAGGGGGGDAGAPATTSQVVVALLDIPAGTEITAQQIQLIDVPTTLVVKGAFSDVQPLIGETTRYPIAAGEQLNQLKVGPQAAGDGLAFVVPKGKRALSVKVDEISGVGGLLLPGDRVDVIAVLQKEDAGLDKAITILQNIEVLAVAQNAQEPVPAVEGQVAAEPGTPEGASSGQLPEDREPQPDARTVTLALAPHEAQLLSLIQDNGKIWLSLRPFGEEVPVDISEATLIPLQSQ